MPLHLGSRIFDPRPFTTLLTAALLVLLISLGFWQLRRAHEKQVLFDEFASGGDALRKIDGTSGALPRYGRVELHGAYDPAHQVLIDNMFDAQGHAGYYVITPLLSDSGQWFLVNRGWVPLGESRAHLPDVTVDRESRRVRGRIDDLPKPGIHMGQPAPLAPPYPVVANFPTRADLTRLLGVTTWASAGEQVLLDAAEPDGYQRRWSPPGFPPARNLAYAVQWFGLALALAVIYVVTNMRRAAPSAS